MISIIIPILDSENSLYNCLNSILNQSFPDFEVLCLIDNTNNRSKEILKYFSFKDSRIKIINLETKINDHLSKQKCLEFAQGDYITFLRDTEWIYSSTLEILFKHAEENNLDLIFYNNDILGITEFDIYNFEDVDKTKLDTENWSKFYSKSALNNENSIERVSFVNKTFKNSQIFKNDNQISGDLIINSSLKQIKNRVNKLERSIQKNHEQTKKFIDSQKNLNKHLYNSANLIIEEYYESRRCFFNNQESNLERYFDTNELFKLCYYNNFKFLSYSPAENRILIETEDGIILESNNRFYTIKEVIGFNGYSIPQLYDFDEFVVFDVGMNRSYASLWFANFENCKFVYGFEIDSETYDKALKNINLNPHLSSKIIPYNFGLSNDNGEVDLYYVPGCDGVSTMFGEVANIQEELQDKSKVQVKKVQVKKTSEIFSKIIAENKITSNIVLKIDTEGAEYNIIKDLIDSNVISKIDVLLGEGHLFEREHYCDKLKELGFKQIKLQITPVTYNFAFVKDIHYNVWPLKE